VNFDEIIELARLHLLNALADINNASTRIEHIRLTALAQEAEMLYHELERFNNGLSYSHVKTDGPAASDDMLPLIES
jgi:hypothetical protein